MEAQKVLRATGCVICASFAKCIVECLQTLMQVSGTGMYIVLFKTAHGSDSTSLISVITLR